MQVEKNLKHPSLTLAEVINDTTSDLNGIQINLNSLAQIVTDNHIPLDFLLTSQGGIYAFANTSVVLGSMRQVK